MSITEKLPGMEPEATLRNIAVGVGYFFLFWVVLFLLPIVAGVVIGTNYRGAADRLTKVPGIEAGGGIKTGAVAGVIGFVLWVVVIGILPGDADDNGADADVAEADEELEEADDPKEVADDDEADDADEAVAEAADEDDADDADDTDGADESDEDDADADDADADDADSDDADEGDDADEDEEYDLTVTVLDQSDEPIQDASVEIMHDDAIIFRTIEDQPTNEDGQVTFTVGEGTHDIDVEADGYEPEDASISVDSDEELTLRLAEAEEEEEEEEDEETSTETPESDDTEADDETETPPEEDDDAADVEDDPDAEDLEDPDEADLTEAEAEVAFEMAAQDNGIDVTEARHTGTEFEVEYTSYATTQEDLAAEIGGLSGAYSSLVNMGHGDDRMMVYGYDVNDDLGYTYYVESDWAQQWYDGEMSDDEFFSLILDTIETYE